MKILSLSIAFGGIATMGFACSTNETERGAGSGGGTANGGANAAPDGPGGASSNGGADAAPDGPGGATPNGGADGGGAVNGGSGGAASGGSSGSGGAPDGPVEGGEGGGACTSRPLPGPGDSGGATPVVCAACMKDQCCAVMNVCTAQEGCASLFECLVACNSTDFPCQRGCRAAVPAEDAGASIRAAASAAFGCRTANCSDCAELSCVGTPWPAPTAPHDLSVVIRVGNFLSGVPFAGAIVKVCAHTDELCAAPLEQGTTAADGTIPFTKVPAAAGGTDAYIEVSGSDILPTLFYPHYLSAAAFDRTIALDTLDLQTAEAFYVLAGGTVTVPDAGIAALPIGSLSINPTSCADAVLVGATVDASNKGAGPISYLVDRIPSSTATTTDASGVAAVVDHPPGITIVTAKLGTRTLSSTDVWVRAGSLTIVLVPPGL